MLCMYGKVLLFEQEHMGQPMLSRARQLGSHWDGKAGHPLLFPAVDTLDPVCVEFEEAEDGADPK